MSTNDIRLRLTVRRHALPEVKLLWPCPASEDLTIAKLLANVSEVVPLEAQEWGLEDYSVEVNGFECLHFEQVCKILKSDDDVIIRSLLTDDLKRRRVSGRHQISTDGRHLVDGVAFGRPRLRATHNRPPVNLPPRKRARTEYAVDDEDDTHLDASPKLLPPAPPSDPSDDGDYDASEDEGADEDLEEEIRVLREDNQLLGDAEDDGDDDEDDDPLDSRTSAAPPSAENSTPNIERTRALQVPSLYKRPLHTLFEGFAQDRLPGGDQDLHATSGIREQTDKSEVLPSQLWEEYLAGGPFSPSLPPTQRPLIQEVEEPVAPVPQRNESSTSSSGESSSDDADTDANIWEFASEYDDADHDDGDDSSDSDQEGARGGADTAPPADDSDSDSSESDSSSEEDEATRPPTKTIGISDDDSSDSSIDSTDTDSTSDDSSSSSDDSDSEPDELSTKTIQGTQQPDVPPGRGLTKTQKRNRRRREQRRRDAKEERSLLAQPNESRADDPNLLARKQALLDAVINADANEDLTTAPPGSALDPASIEDILMAEDTPQDQQPESSIVTGLTEAEDTTSQATPADAAFQEETPRRRMRMDVGAGRRLLFGALGLKNPKTKADEEKLKEDLMKDVRPLKNYRQEEVTAEAATASDALRTESTPGIEKNNDDTAWRGKIKYRAIECCQEGIELSEPPFPFVQRWDPQQQPRRKRKRGSQKPQPEEHHDDSYQDDSLNGAKNMAADDNNDTSNIELNYDDPLATSNGEESQAMDVDDLPSLPQDVATLPPLQSTEVKPGMVITWKQLLMSKATNWQPQLSSTTAVVIAFDNDGTLRVMLAKRDREEDKQYDAETGRRVYDRFEMPSDSDNEAESDDGRRELAWAELIEPRLVQAEPLTSTPNTPAETPQPQANEPENHGNDDVSPAQPIDSDHRESSGDSSTIPPGQSARLADFSAPSIDVPMNGEVSQDKISQTQSEESQPVHPSSQEPSSQVRVFLPSSVLGETQETNNSAPDNASDQDGAPSLRPKAATQDQPNEPLPNEDAPMADLLPTMAETGPKGPQVEADASPDSSSPFPSLEELWHTARSSRQTQSPLKSSQASALRKASVKSDPDYEAVMQKLDDGEEGDESDSLPTLKSNRSIRTLFPNATQPSPATDAAAEPAPKRARRGPLVPFRVPEGSQVIELLSSAPGSPKSPEPPEDYAEDSVDESYIPPDDDDDKGSSLPHGSGWVTKNKRRVSKEPNKKPRKHTVAAPARRSRPLSSASAVFGKRKNGGRKL